MLIHMPGNRGSFTADPGRVSNARCDACGTVFICPHHKESWHAQAVRLMSEVEEILTANGMLE